MLSGIKRKKKKSLSKETRRSLVVNNPITAAMLIVKNHAKRRLRDDNGTFLGGGSRLRFTPHELATKETENPSGSRVNAACNSRKSSVDYTSPRLSSQGNKKSSSQTLSGFVQAQVRGVFFLLLAALRCITVGRSVNSARTRQLTTVISSNENEMHACGA